MNLVLIKINKDHFFIYEIDIFLSLIYITNIQKFFQNQKEITMSIKILIGSDILEVKKWPYLLILPLMWLITFWVIIKKRIYAVFHKSPMIHSLIFDGIGKYGQEVRKNATGWKAVDLIYNHKFGEDKSIGGRLNDFWFNSMNCQAARNRFKLARLEIKNAILQLTNKKEIRIIALAGGTSQIENEILKQLSEFNVTPKIILIDINNDALNRAKEYIAEYKHIEQIDLIQADILYGIEIANRFKPQIIEMIAFLDYLPKKEAIEFLSKIYGILPSDGFCISSNTMPNLEMHFVEWVVNWPLIYRKPHELNEIFLESGFTKIKIIKEPLNIQTIVVAQK